MTSKSWVYTLNNYTEEDVRRFKDFEYSYQVIGKEVGEEGTPHLQGFITWKRAYRLPQLQKLVPRAHWEVAKCTDAGNYCMKEAYEVLDNRKQGKRSDLSDAVDCLKEGGIKLVKMNHPETYVRYHNGLEKLDERAPRNFKPMVTWIWGPTGVGKTRSVVESENDLWISGKDLRWWQGYEAQEAVLFDDFRRDFCTFHMLLRLLDRYPCTVEVKGGSRQLTAQRMYITSCYHPETVYDTREDVQQLIRRIDLIKLMEPEEVIFLPPPVLVRSETIVEDLTWIDDILND